MKSYRLLSVQILVIAISVCLSNVSYAQFVEKPVVEVQQAKTIVADIIQQFEEYYLKGDSIALAALYTKDGRLASATGKDILPALGRMIRSSIKNNSRHVSFTSTSISVEGEFIVELGIAEAKDDQGNHKWKYKYLVVYKQEDGKWKLHRDIAL